MPVSQRRLRFYDFLLLRLSKGMRLHVYCLTLPYLTVGQGREAVDRVSKDCLVRGDDRPLDQVFFRVVSCLIQRRERRRIWLVVAEVGGREEGKKEGQGRGGVEVGRLVTNLHSH